MSNKIEMPGENYGKGRAENSKHEIFETLDRDLESRIKECISDKLKKKLADDYYGIFYKNIGVRSHYYAGLIDEFTINIRLGPPETAYRIIYSFYPDKGIEQKIKRPSESYRKLEEEAISIINDCVLNSIKEKSTTFPRPGSLKGGYLKKNKSSRRNNLKSRKTRRNRRH